VAADAAKAFMRKFLYPYHFGRTDPKQLLAGPKKKDKGIEVRIRDMK
jgi:hypothetical protein